MHTCRRDFVTEPITLFSDLYDTDAQLISAFISDVNSTTMPKDSPPVIICNSYQYY